MSEEYFGIDLSDQDSEEYIPGWCYFLDDFKCSHLVKKEIEMEPKKLSVSSGSASQEEHAKAGTLVSELKTDLHEAEQSITNVKLHEVDWSSLYEKAMKLFALIEKLVNKGQPSASDTSDMPTHRTSESHHGKRHK